MNKTIFAELAAMDALRAPEIERARTQVDAAVRRVGPGTPSSWTGDPRDALTFINVRLGRMAETLQLLGEARAVLPSLEEAAAAERRQGHGKWILLGVILMIVLIVLIGQVIS